MAYSKTTWAANDVITAAKMNKLEQGVEDAQNGWDVDASQIFSETVTTTDVGGGFIVAQLAYSQKITDSTIIVDFGGTEYTCANNNGEYGAAWTGSGYDWSTYPFNIMYDSHNNVNLLATQSAGTYSVAVSAESVTTTTNFDKAVKKASGGDVFVVNFYYSGYYYSDKTFAEISSALTAGKTVIGKVDGLYSIGVFDTGGTYIDFMFIHLDINSNILTLSYYTINNDDTIQYSSVDYTLTPA